MPPPGPHGWGCHHPKAWPGQTSGGSFTWLEVDAGCQLRAQLGPLTRAPTCGLCMWPGVLTAWRLAFCSPSVSRANLKDADRSCMLPTTQPQKPQNTAAATFNWCRRMRGQPRFLEREARLRRNVRAAPHPGRQGAESPQWPRGDSTRQERAGDLRRREGARGPRVSARGRPWGEMHLGEGWWGRGGWGR